MEEVAEGRSSDRGELDALTNLSDRQSFLSRLIALCVPEPPAGAALLRIDLVRFSRINMALGPRIADRVLKQVAERIRKSAPDAIDVARVSGDGFAVLLDDSQSFKATVDHIVDIVRRPILISGSVVELDAYIGGSSVVDGISDGYDLLQAAEIALAHAAKAPDRAAFYAPGMKADIARTYIIERDLRTTVSRQQRALLAGEPNPNFSLTFQPKVDLRSGQLTGFEALLRFTMIDGTPIPPDDFIPVAEQCGLMHVIGMWVIQSACAALALLPEVPLRRSQHRT